MGSGASGDSPPAAKAGYSAPSSRTSTPADHPSLTTWCITTTRRWSSAPRRTSRVRRSGPSARSKGADASRAATARAAASRSPAGRAPTSSVSSVHGAGERTTCTGCPSTLANTVRSDSWRRTISVKARESASASSAPVRRSASGMLYAAVPGWSTSMNQSRSCAQESGRCSGRATVIRPVPARTPSPAVSGRRISASSSAASVEIPSTSSRRVSGSCTPSVDSTTVFSSAAMSESSPSVTSGCPRSIRAAATPSTREACAWRKSSSTPCRAAGSAASSASRERAKPSSAPATGASSSTLTPSTGTRCLRNSERQRRRWIFPLEVLGTVPGFTRATAYTCSSCSRATAARMAPAISSRSGPVHWRVTSCTTTSRSSPPCSIPKAAHPPGRSAECAREEVCSTSCG